MSTDYNKYLADNNYDYHYFIQIPEDELTSDMCINMLRRKNFPAIYFNRIPSKFLKKELFDALLEHIKSNQYITYSDTLIKYVPLEYQTDELVESLIIKCGWNILCKNLNPKFINEKFVRLAVKSTPSILERCYSYYNNKWLFDYLTEDDILLFITHKNTFLLSSVPVNLRSYNVCLLASKWNHYNFWDIPKNLLTSEMIYMTLVAGVNKYYIKYCISKTDLKNIMRCVVINHEELVTEEILLYYFTECKSNFLSIIPDKFRTREFMTKLIQHNPKALQLVPKHIKTLEFCKSLPMTNELYKYMPKKYLEFL